jgi:hypothetical protein
MLHHMARFTMLHHMALFTMLHHMARLARFTKVCDFDNFNIPTIICDYHR